MTSERPQTEKSLVGRNLLVASALMYLVLGLLFIVFPSSMASSLGYPGLENEALIEFMASYGGLWTGIGVLLFIHVRKQKFKAGLNVVLWTFAGFAFGRSVASIRFAGFYGLHFYWLAFELVWILITLRYLKKMNYLKKHT